MEYAAIIAAIAGVIGNLLGSGKDAEAAALREKIAAEYGPEILPQLDKAVAEQAGPSAFANTPENDTARRGQLDVQSELERIYDTGGQTEGDKAAYDLARRGVSQQAASRAGGIGLEAARRGQTAGPLGAVLASQSGQDELNALAGLNAQIASDSRGRALQALMARGQSLGQMRGQDWQSASERANAMDLMGRFNASQRQATSMYNTGLSQQQFDNNMRRLGAQAAAREGVAQGNERAGAADRQTAAGFGNSALSFGQAWDWQQKKEKDK